MDKLTRYNQKLLAIIGTIVLATFIILILVAIGSLIMQMIASYDNNDNALKAQTATISNDSSQVIRTQTISFHEPVQLDTAQAKFIIPVGQVNLQKATRALLNKDESTIMSINSVYYYESYYGQFSNFIYYDHDKKFKKSLFNLRIAISHWAFLQHDQEEVLLFKGALKDTNADNLLDNDDYLYLFAYFIADDKMVSFEMDHCTVLNFDPLPKTDLVYITVGIDSDQDFVYENNHEPQKVMVLNLQTRKLEDLIPAEMQKEVQRLIDGV